MKKIIIAVAAVMVSAVAAYAQSAGAEVRMARNGFETSARAKQTAQVSASVKPSVAPQALERVVLQQVEKQKQDSAANSAAKPVASKKHAVSNEKGKQVATSAAASNTRGKTAWQWLKAIALGRQLPTETLSQYRARLGAQGYAATVPSK